MTDSTTRPAPPASPPLPPIPPTRSRGRSWAVFGLFGVLSTIFLFDAVLSGGAYVLRDILTFFHPWQTAAREAVRGGHLPLWNPDTFCGVPQLANLQTGFFYPINWLTWFLPFDVALTAGMVLHLTLAGFLLRSFLRRIGLGERGAFLGGAIFAYGAWTFANLEFPMRIGSIVWTPLLWIGLWSAMREGRRLGLVQAGLAVALSILAGDPQLAVYGFLSATLLAVFLGAVACRDPGWSPDEKLHRLGAWPIAAVLGVATAAAQLLPAAEMAELSSRATAYEPAAAMSRSLPPRALLGAVDPFLFGFPGADRFWGGEIGEYCFGAFHIGLLPLVLVVAGAPVFRTWRRKRRVRREDRGAVDPGPLVPRLVPWFLATGALVGAVLALGRHTPVYPFLLEWGPGFGRARWPATAGVMIALHLAPLAGIGLEWILRERARVRRTTWVVLGLGVATLVTWLLALGPLDDAFRAFQTEGATPFQRAAYEAGRSSWLSALLVRGSILLAAGALGLTIGQIRSRAATAWMALVLFDLFVTARALDMPVARGFYDREPASVAALREELGGHRFHTPRTLDQLGNLLYGIRNPKAFDWAQRHLLGDANVVPGIAGARGDARSGSERHEALARAFEEPGISPELRGRLLDLWDAAATLESDVRPEMIATLADTDRGPIVRRHQPRLGRAAVLTGWDTLEGAPSVLDGLLSPSHDPRTRVLLEGGPDLPSPPKSQAPIRRAEIVPCEYGPNSIRIAWHVGEGGMLRVLESWAPGWTAKVNGETAPVYRADYLYLSVPVPAGSCEVVLEYRPTSVRNGLVLSAIGIGLLGLGAVTGRRPRAAPTKS